MPPKRARKKAQEGSRRSRATRSDYDPWTDEEAMLSSTSPLLGVDLVVSTTAAAESSLSKSKQVRISSQDLKHGTPSTKQSKPGSMPSSQLMSLVAPEEDRTLLG